MRRAGKVHGFFTDSAVRVPVPFMEAVMATKCDACCGAGMYPIFNSRGREVYSIRCPECFGLGSTETEEETVERLAGEGQRRKYEQAMREKRSA